MTDESKTILPKQIKKKKTDQIAEKATNIRRWIGDAERHIGVKFFISGNEI